MKFALIRERKNPPDRRVVLSPVQAAQLEHAFAKAELLIEPSQVRIFPDSSYTQAGLQVAEDITEADVMIGVKEVPVDALIPGKKYFFFSHTIKKQPYNRDLLCAILDKKIELYDHETIVNESNMRLIGFGRYAGLVGAYNAFRALGLKDNLFKLPKVDDLADFDAVKTQLELIRTELPPVNIVITGSGKVSGGIKEILELLHIHELTPKEFLQLGQFQNNQTVFTQLDVDDYYTRKDGLTPTKTECYNNPELLESDFMKFAAVADILITGHFYGDGAPYFFTREDMKSENFNISLVADVSCDINGPIACTLRASTIADPLYGYDPSSEKEVAFNTPGSIAVMAVDNLPCELPKDASEGFGEMFLEHVFPAFFNDDADGILERAKMTTKDGTLTERFSYLEDYVNEPKTRF
ncbi:NAD(P)-dependent oxidoreductase [Nonlabens marinus]|uniref:Lysine ketoglutarate reductase n=1 Tax=Nonlabens marinus S1-08 TaxID=1454201 RepID=W8VP16_9FLAO|nr:NAD(P)-dependent oxidoreductase [Nonlabens marinus]BAO54185.1 lysine ketoglutarate reductase [Nonlabens marinus S1-08]